MTRLEQALALAARGFWIFPCAVNAKKPAIGDWPNRATRDTAQITRWWNDGERNIGIATEKFGDDRALVVVDVDCKNGKDGYAELFRLELEGHELPRTLAQSTPSGGAHLIYVVDEPLKQGVDTLGVGLDIRSRGGFIVGAGSVLANGEYAINDAPIAQAPQWLVNRLGADRSVRTINRDPIAGVDAERAVKRGIEYLKTAPMSVKGQGGDQTAYKVAAQLKDVGCTQEQTLDLMMSEHWHHGCGWELSKLNNKVTYSFRYGKNPPGIDAPEAVFDAVKPAEVAANDSKHPFDTLNAEYAFVKRGAFVLQETTDERGNRAVEHLNMAEFHGWFANVPFQAGKKTMPISQWWVEWPQRRQFEGVVFMPQQDAGPRWFNMWTGFSVEPAASGDHPAVTAFLEHALKNVCNNEPKLLRWLIGYFAHMVQRPWEKPLVALVFRGAKGTGKNALVERIGYLFGSHFMVADDDRYLLSNFNAHFESNLFLALDEASWAGDKRAEGRLKGLITGKQHNIERKGKETYRVDNLTRVAIIGNEDWLVPASQDERRFAVFNVGDGRKQDRDFFKDMREGMEKGGYAHLLRYLMDFDMRGIDVNDAPKTAGLIDQKHANLTPVPEWWLNCLMAQEIIGADFGGDWPDSIATNRLRAAFRRWAGERNIRARLPNEHEFGRTFKKLAPSMARKKVRPDNSGDSSYSYVTPGIAVLRKDWEGYIGGELSWDEC